MKTETSRRGGGLKSQDAQNEWPDGSVVRKKMRLPVTDV